MRVLAITDAPRTNSRAYLVSIRKRIVTLSRLLFVPRLFSILSVI